MLLLDSTSEESVVDVMRRVVAPHGRIDALVNRPGAGARVRWRSCVVRRRGRELPLSRIDPVVLPFLFDPLTLRCFTGWGIYTSPLGLLLWISSAIRCSDPHHAHL